MTQTVRKTDQELQSNVTDELRYNPSLDSTNLTVSAQNGVVTLAGDVASFPERHAAKRAAMRIWGVKAVADDMVVRDEGASIRDTDINEAAIQQLTWAVDVPSDTVKAVVQDHKVTLSGTVAWNYQREAAARAVMYIRGVTAVANTISLTATMPPTGIKGAIDAAILRNAQLDAQEIDVDVDDGVVTLKGAVRSLDERRQAEHVAWSAPGVKSVHNNLSVVA